MGIMNKKVQLVATLAVLLGVAQVQAASHCRAINVCDDTVDAKWTERVVGDAFSKFGASLAYNWKPSTKSGCLSKGCKVPVTVSIKAPASSADNTFLDEFITSVVASPKTLSKVAVCVEDATAAMLSADKTCLPFKPVGLSGNVLCRSAQVCSDFVDFAWVEVEANKAISAFLKKSGLATDGITVSKASSVAGCTCKNPTTITVTVKVPLTANFAAIDAGLAKTLAGLAAPLKAACAVTDATAAYIAARPICKKPTAAVVKPAATTVCRDVQLCDNAVDYAWTKITAEDAFAPLFKALKLPQDATHFSVTKVAGTSLKAGTTSCTCKTRAVVKITVPATNGAAAKVDAFIASVQSALPEVQCLASAVAASCKQPGASSGVVGCRTWTLADDNVDWAWTVQTVKKELAECFSATGTPTSGLAITRATGTCATIAGKQCCAKNIATVKVTGVPSGQDAAFGICARAALTVANLGKPFKCAAAGPC